jgi:hypothetical protein
MTQIRCAPASISNYFDDLLKGIGHRGSSFTDIDAATHDEATDRWLFQEFKGPDETLNRGQARHLLGLARQDYATVWCVRKRHDGYLDWCDVRSRQSGVITTGEYQARFRRWWNREPVIPTETATLIMADAIRW